MNDRLNASLYFVDPDIKKAQSLPFSVFWDAEFHKHAFETIFTNSWLCFPKQILRRAVDISEREDPSKSETYLDILLIRGNEVLWDFLGEGILLKRDTDTRKSSLFCFSNRCPHMGYPMLKQRINRAGPKWGKYMQCGQHHLTVNADGTFKSHPAWPNPDAKTRKTLCLTRYDLEEWQDFYFICRGKPAAPLNNVLKPMLDVIDCMPPDWFQYEKNANEQRILDGNWMLHAQNYMDTLHIKEGIHTGEGGLEGALIMDSYTTEFFADNPFMTLQWAYAKNPEDGFDPKFLPERFHDPSHPERRVFALWFFQFPNITWNFYPWGLSLCIYMPIPEDVDHTELFWFHYVLDQEKYSERNTRWLSNLVDLEDTDALRLVNRTLRGHARPWQRSIFGEEKEKGPHWFHKMVYEMMFS